MNRLLIVLAALLLAVPVFAQSADAPDAPADRVTSTDGTLTVIHPEDWISMPFYETGVMLSNSEDLLAGDGPVIPEAGEVFVQVTYNPRGPYIDENDALDLAGVLGLVLSEFAGAQDLFSAPEADEINGLPALTAIGTLDLIEVQANAYILAVDRAEDGVWVLLTALTRVEDFAAFEPELRALAENIVIDSTLVPRVSRAETVVSEDLELTLSNPNGWFTLTEDFSNIALATSSNLLFDQRFDRIVFGDFVFRVSLQPRIFVFSDQVGTLTDLMTAATASFSGGEDIDFVEFDVNGHPAIRTRFTSNPGNFNEIDLMYLFVDFVDLDRVLVLIGIASEGEIGRYEADILEMVETALLFGEPIPALEGE
jgi:hypothetical protein